MHTSGYEGSQFFSWVGWTGSEDVVEPTSQPIPSLSPSNLCGSGGITLKFEYPISPQSKSGGYSGIHTSGYDESQLFSWVGWKRRKSLDELPLDYRYNQKLWKRIWNQNLANHPRKCKKSLNHSWARN